ncbi:unnamed protein product [Musa acuminata var. zebrina]
MGLLAETPLFVDTNLGTRFALSVPDNITAGDLKRKLKCEHNSCFPALGKIVVHSLMVKQKSFLYHIPDSMPIKEACQGFRSTWFLRMDATRLTDVSMHQASIPSSMNQFRRRDSPYLEETVMPNSYKLPASSNSNCCTPGGRFICTEVDMDHILEGSISNMIDCSNASKAVDFTISTVTATNMINQAGNIVRDCSTWDEREVDVPSLPLISQKSLSKRRKLEHGIQGNVVGKESVISNKTRKSGVSSSLDSGKEVRKDNTAPNATQKDKAWVSEGPSEKEQHKNSLSMEETPSMNLSEKISVTGLISRYFSNQDEASTCSNLHKNVMDTQNVTVQPTSMLNTQEFHLNEATGFAMKDVQSSADDKSSNEGESDCNTACSFNINKETKHVCLTSNNVRKIAKSKPTTSEGRVRPSAIISSAKKDPRVAESRCYEAGNTTSCGNKSLISSSQVNRKLVHARPRRTSTFSSLSSPISKRKRIFSSNDNKNEVGKRLVQAANKIYSSVSAEKLPQSRYISRCGNMSAPNSIVIPKRFSFEINDSDD